MGDRSMSPETLQVLANSGPVGIAVLVIIWGFNFYNKTRDQREDDIRAEILRIEEARREDARQFMEYIQKNFEQQQRNTEAYSRFEASLDELGKTVKDFIRMVDRSDRS